ncbi:hypothetical protein QTP70_001031 [Hemibagrus guttatus]|uniref:Ig-like domain-containing protein n=1 Tax=Hemibagrus guttatus TaxID=175788 RepID=A0AAE0UGV4_9TELE|nr:hypothetical protein QTP70_001031 [Hemibagrus guttatus]
MLFLFVVFFTLADVAEAADNSIKPDQTNVFSTEGSNISLSCTYTGSVNSLHWYRQKPGSRPEFLLLIDESGDSMADSIKPLFTHKVVEEGNNITLSCRYETTVTANTKPCNEHKTLQQIVKTTENIIRVSLSSSKDPYQKVYIYKAVSFVNITSPFYQTLSSPAIYRRNENIWTEHLLNSVTASSPKQN